MSNIIEFPTKSVQDWNTIEKTLRDILNKSDASSDFTKVILERMELAYKEHEFDYQMSFNLPPEYVEQVNEQLTAYTKALQKRTTDLLFSRLKIEIELAKSQGY